MMQQAHISFTRLSLRSFWFLRAFLRSASSCIEQAKSSSALIYGATIYEFPFTFSTITVWANEQELKKYVATGAHRKALPMLQEWCKEAVSTHYEWNHKVEELEYTNGYQKLKTGKFFYVKFPSKFHKMQKPSPLKKYRCFPFKPLNQSPPA